MLPLRVVVDTNVLVSAVLKPHGLPRTAVLLALTKPARCYVSEAILLEYNWVMSRPQLRIPLAARRQMMQLIRNRTRVVVPKYRISVTSDPDDNIFVECADAGRADYLVTGNARHYPEFWKSTKVVSAREFVGIAAPHLLR